MTISIHQPNYLPWLGFFNKMANSDLFVILDNAQYEKNGMTNRVKIKTSNGPAWLTLPIKGKFLQTIDKVELVDWKKEKERQIKTIEFNYKKAVNFEKIFPELKTILEYDWKYLADLNKTLIVFLAGKLGINTKIIFASDYPIEGKSTDRLVDICKLFKTDTYLSGNGGRDYQEENKFTETNIKLKYANYIPIEYPQLWGEFVGGLSALDYLMNCENSKWSVNGGIEPAIVKK